MKTYIHLYISQFFLERKYEYFRRKLQRKSKSTLYVQPFFFRKTYRLWNDAEKHGRVRQATEDNIIRRMGTAFLIPKVTNTHTEYVVLFAFPRQ